MEKEILTALVEMVKSGGQMAVFGIIAYWGMQILAIAVKGGFLCLGIQLISKVLTHCWDNYQLNKACRTVLISKEASDTLMQSVKSNQTTYEGILRDIQNDIQILLSALKEKSEPQASAK